MEDGEHEVTGAVSGERAAGAVGSMSTWGEAEDEDAGEWVSKSGDGFGPVGLVDVGASALLADALAVFAESGAELAGDDGGLRVGEWGG